jgi:hypothetical protein
LRSRIFCSLRAVIRSSSSILLILSICLAYFLERLSLYFSMEGLIS